MAAPSASAFDERIRYWIFYSLGLVIAAMIVGIAGLALALVLALGGISREQVTTYSVPKAEVLDQLYPARKPVGGESPAQSPTKEAQDRMLAAIVLHGSQAWFFKVSGSQGAVAKQADSFSSFVRSIHFDGLDSPPHWTLPEGWEQQPGNEMRFATLQIGTPEEPLELAVSSLPKGEGDDAEYLLANVNRWRGQLGLPRIGLPALDKQLQKVPLEGSTAYVVDYSGRLGSGGMSPAPFASGNQPPSSTNAPKPRGLPEAPPLSRSGGVTFKAPESWLAGKAGGMRKASFVVQDGGKSAEITIIDLAAAANDLLTNVNRWRGQVKLKEIGREDLSQHVREIDVGGVKGHYVELVGPADAQPRQTILGVVAFVDDKAWFIKLSGDAELAEREKQNFEAFVRSIQFQR